MTRLAGIIAAALVSVAGTASADYGSIYYSEQTGAYGYAWNYATQDAAEDAAYRECRQQAKDCTMATWFSNACGALAISDNTDGWAGQWGNTIREAERKAMSDCRDKYGNKGCKIEVSFCSDQ
jgi:serine/threonine-protein kinase